MAVCFFYVDKIAYTSAEDAVKDTSTEFPLA